MCDVIYKRPLCDTIAIFSYSILWNFATSVNEFEFKSIEDVLDENNQLKIENEYLKGVLDSNITEILQKLGEQAINITDLRIQQEETKDVIQANTNMYAKLILSKC